jgi:predicted dehydrogenase
MDVSPRIAIVGCGAVVEQRHASVLKQLGWRPTVLIDTSAQRRLAVATLFETAPMESDDAIAVADCFDMAIVATPQGLHERICVDLLRAGKHVFVEKPMAHSSFACAAMNRAAAESGAKLAIALFRRQATAGRWLKEALQVGAFGQLRRFEIQEGYEYDWPLTTDSMWRKEQAGGGVLIDTGAHTMDQVVWWFGEPDEVEYFDDADGGVEANALVRMRWRSGLEGEVELSRTRRASNKLALECEKGALNLSMSGNEFGVSTDAMLAFSSSGFHKPPFEPTNWTAMFREQLFQFSSYIRGQIGHVVSGQEGARSVALIERCYAVRRRLEQPWIHYVDAS